jgi:hypothetical protein
MRAFEIRLNGKRLCIAGMEEGMLLCGVACTENNNRRGDVGLDMTGISYLKEELVRWKRRTLRTNDVVRVKIIETNKVDKPKLVQKGFPKKKSKQKERRKL